MKKVVTLSLVLVAALLTVRSQSLEFIPATAVFKEKSQDTVYYITVKVKDIPKKGLLIKTDIEDLNAANEKDYDLLDKKRIEGLTFESGSENLFTIGILVKKDNFGDEGNEQFRLLFTYDRNKRATTDTLLITIKDSKPEPEPSLPDTAKWGIRIVTGSNFDFFEAPVFKNFAGDLNIFLPNLKQFKLFGKPTGVGISLGVFNYRYYDSDSSGSNIVNERYLVDPTIRNIIIDSTKYVREIYALNSKTSYNNWGLYLNPIFTLKNDKWYDLYLELHCEVIWRTQIKTYSQVMHRKDTFTVSKSDTLQRAVFQSFKGIRSLYEKQSYFDTYFGIGLPLKVNIKKAFELFVTPSFGMSSFGTTAVATSEALSIRSRTFIQEKKWQGYFLTKFQLTTTVAPVDITFGGEYRKIFNQNSFIGMYLGAAITIDKLKR